MKTLIITMTCGEGHNQIAKGIKAELDLREEENKIIQLYGFSEREVARQNDMFLNVCKRIPHIYEGIWKHLRKRNINKPSIVINNVIKDCKAYVYSQIQEYKPDNIICTHSNSGAVVQALKQEGMLEGIKTYSVVFDYCLCPYWEFNNKLDYVVLPAEFMHEEIKAKGFNDEQILTFGLPVDPKYTKYVDRNEARELLGLDKDKFAVVLYSGGHCISSAYKMIKQLQKCKRDIQIVAICGRNKKEYDRIQKYITKKNIKNVILEGFCTKLDLYYSACDLVISRGGGMGLTEQIHKNIPFVLREGLIINERINKKLFERMGLAEGIDRITQAPKIVDELASNSQKLANMKEAGRKIIIENSTQKFVDFIVKEREQ